MQFKCYMLWNISLIFTFFGLFCRTSPHSLSSVSYCSLSVEPLQTDGDDCSCSARELLSSLSVCRYFSDIRFSFNAKYFGPFCSLSNFILVSRDFAIPLSEPETQNNVYVVLYYLYWRLAGFKFLYDTNHQKTVFSDVKPFSPVDILQRFG